MSTRSQMRDMGEDPQQGMCDRLIWLTFRSSWQLLLFRLELSEARLLLSSGKSSLMQQFGLSSATWEEWSFLFSSLAFHLPVSHFVLELVSQSPCPSSVWR